MKNFKPIAIKLKTMKKDSTSCNIFERVPMKSAGKGYKV